MPKISRETATRKQELAPLFDLAGELAEYTVNFTSFQEDVDGTPLMKGLPDDRCQCPHWGYVVSGHLTLRFADHDEVFEAGDAFYAPPGHIPVQEDPGTEIVMFSPTEELRKTEDAMQRNMQALHAH